MFVASETTLKQSRKVIVEIITSSTTHEPIKYLNIFHLYAHNAQFDVIEWIVWENLNMLRDMGKGSKKFQVTVTLAFPAWA